MQRFLITNYEFLKHSALPQRLQPVLLSYICEQWFTGIYLDQKTQYEKICEQHLVVIFDDISIAYCFRGHVIIVNATLHYNTLLITIKKEDLRMLIDVTYATQLHDVIKTATEQLTSLSQLNKQSLALFTCSFSSFKLGATNMATQTRNQRSISISAEIELISFKRTLKSQREGTPTR